MAFKKITDTEATVSVVHAERKFSGVKSDEKYNMNHPAPTKHMRGKSKAEYSPGVFETISLTDVQIARIEAICAVGSDVTEYVKSAISTPWKPGAV
jgi:hypothetical protein